MNDERLTLYFRFLDNLREGGSINMLGAAQPLKDRFGLETEEANTAHSLWMETFTHELTAAERADEALRRVAARS